MKTFSLFLALLAAPALAGAPCADSREGQLFPTEPLRFAGTPIAVGSDTAVASLVCALQANPALTVHIEAHTDSRGADTYNQKVSQARADALKDALLAAGIAPERLGAVGYGETMPLDTNTTTDGRAQNRRVELHTEPFHSRPKPPAALPEPEPTAPAEPVADTWCTALAGAIAARRSDSWTRSADLASVATRMGRCLGPDWTVNRDGDALYAQHPDWQLAVELDPSGAKVSLRPNE